MSLADAGLLIYNQVTKRLNWWTGSFWSTNSALTVNAVVQIKFTPPVRRTLRTSRGSKPITPHQDTQGQAPRVLKKTSKAPKKASSVPNTPTAVVSTPVNSPSTRADTPSPPATAEMPTMPNAYDPPPLVNNGSSNIQVTYGSPLADFGVPLIANGYISGLGVALKHNIDAGTLDVFVMVNGKEITSIPRLNIITGKHSASVSYPSFISVPAGAVLTVGALPRPDASGHFDPPDNLAQVNVLIQQ